MMSLEEAKGSIDPLTLQELRDSILCEMRNKPLLSREACEYLLQAYTDKLAELYW